MLNGEAILFLLINLELNIQTSPAVQENAYLTQHYLVAIRYRRVHY